MKITHLSQMNSMDHDDVKELAGGSEKLKKKYRLKIIKRFLKWQNRNKDMWKTFRTDSDEKVVLSRLKYHKTLITGFGLLTNFLIYQAFMTGIYNYRSNELLRMRKVPFVLKLGVSSMLSLTMAYTMYVDSLYDQDTYKLSLKYRLEYDTDYKSYLEKSTTVNGEFNP